MQQRPKKVYIETVGCQMNVLDSELLRGALRQRGYELTDSIRAADVVLFNTCSVRQHAEDKVYSALGRLQHRKRRRPELVIGVIGCMAQKDQRLIFHRAPHVDLIAGPGQLARVPELVETVLATRRRQAALSLPRKGRRAEVAASFEEYDPERLADSRPARFQAYVRIMMGCDKFCTFCVVPMVRGPEQSRPPHAILEEVRRLADQGCLEVTFIGQTVNSYKYRHGDGRVSRLADLLAAANDISGLRRIKFVTNYPRDMSRELLEAVRDLPKVCPYFHLPVQHGSNAQLKLMKRGYTVEQYEELLGQIRELVPEATIATDFIAGFCHETEADHERSCRLIERAGFKNCFIFKYSPRPGTKAYQTLPDDVPEEVKRRRNNELLAIQNRIGLEQNQRLIGSVVEVLVEGPSKLGGRDGEPDHRQLTGRTRQERIVVFDGPERLIGQFVHVRIGAVTPTTLMGSIVSPELAAAPSAAPGPS